MNQHNEKHAARRTEVRVRVTARRRAADRDAREQMQGAPRRRVVTVRIGG